MGERGEAKVTARDAVRMLRERYEFPEWVLESEVTLEGRRLDVLAFNQWAARHRLLVGFEVKVTRADWLREVRAFEKAAPAVRACDQFYVVAPSKVVQSDELPVGWGLLEIQGSRLVTKAYPAKTEPSPVMPRELAARLLSRYVQAEQAADRTAEYRAREDIRAEIGAHLEKEFARSREHEREELRTLRQEYSDLLRALGVDATRWRAHEDAMRAAGVLTRYDRDAGALRQQLERTAAALDVNATAVRDALSTLNGGTIGAVV